MHDKTPVDVTEILRESLAISNKVGRKARDALAKENEAAAKLAYKKKKTERDARREKHREASRKSRRACTSMASLILQLNEFKKLKARKPNRAPLAFSYSRVSHVDQVDGDSMPAQQSRCEAYYQFRLKDQGIGWGGAEVEGRNESARKKSFIHRPAGSRIMEKIQRGDHLIVDKVDRLWRNVRDFSNLLQLFKDIDIHVHFVSFSGCSLEIGTPMGDFFLTVMVACAQLESDRTSERNKLASDRRKAEGRYHDNKIIPGASLTMIDGKRHYEWDRTAREIMSRLVEIEDTRGKTNAEDWKEAEITWRMVKQHMSRDAAIASLKTTRKRHWSRRRCLRWAVREREIRHYGIEDPNKISLYPFIHADELYRDPAAFEFVSPHVKALMIRRGIVRLPATDNA